MDRDMTSYTVRLKGRKRKVTDTGKRKAMDMFLRTARRPAQKRPRSVAGETRTRSGAPVRLI